MEIFFFLALDAELMLSEINISAFCLKEKEVTSELEQEESEATTSLSGSACSIYQSPLSMKKEIRPKFERDLKLENKKSFWGFFLCRC